MFANLTRLTPALVAMIVAVGAPAAPRLAHAQASADIGKESRKEVNRAMEEESASSNPANPNILELEAPLAIWSLVVFLILFGLLRAFAWKPIMKALDDREHNQERMLRETEEARAESARLLAEHEKQLAAAAETIRGLIDQGRKDAQTAADAIVKKAQDDAESARKSAHAEINAARDQALAEIWSKTSDLAVAVAGKVLAKSLSDDDHRRLIAAAIDSLPSAAANGAAKGART